MALKTIVGMFREQAGVGRALEELRQASVPPEHVRLVRRGDNLGVDLSGAGGGHIFAAELERGATLLVVEADDGRAHDVAVALRRAGADDIESDADEAGREVEIGAGDPAEPSEPSAWNRGAPLAYGAEMGAGAAAGGVMGAPIGPGVTEAAGGLMGATPGERPADDLPSAAPNPERQADIARQRRETDPAP